MESPNLGHLLTFFLDIFRLHCNHLNILLYSVTLKNIVDLRVFCNQEAMGRRSEKWEKTFGECVLMKNLLWDTVHTFFCIISPQAIVYIYNITLPYNITAARRHVCSPVLIRDLPALISFISLSCVPTWTSAFISLSLVCFLFRSGSKSHRSSVKQ